jgi:hypothetical protein
VRGVRAAIAVAILGTFLAGCAATLDTGALETQIADRIESETGLDVASVTCPDGVEVATGTSFTCDIAIADGAVVAVTVTQVDDEGNVQAEVPDALGAAS